MNIETYKCAALHCPYEKDCLRKQLGERWFDYGYKCNKDSGFDMFIKRVEVKQDDKR